MSSRAFLRFSVNGKEMLAISPAKLLESYLSQGEFNHLPYVTMFPLGTEILCGLECNGHRLQVREKVIDEVMNSSNPPESAEKIAAALIKRLTGKSDL